MRQQKNLMIRQHSGPRKYQTSLMPARKVCRPQTCSLPDLTLYLSFKYTDCFWDMLVELRKPPRLED